jgi:hypothetical protein
MSIGITFIRIRDSLPFFKKFKLVEKVLISNDIEEQLGRLSDLFKKLICTKLDLFKCSQVLRSENHLKVSLQFIGIDHSRVIFHKSNEKFASCKITFKDLDGDDDIESAGFVPSKFAKSLISFMASFIVIHNTFHGNSLLDQFCQSRKIKPKPQINDISKLYKVLLTCR